MFQTFFGGLLLLSAALVASLVLTVPVACAGSTAPVLDVQKMIAEAVAAGQHTVTLPVGRFQLATPNVTLNNIHDLTIEGAGPEQTVLLAGPQGMFNVEDCQRITFRNFAVDYDPLPFTQATITKISDVDANTIALDFEVHAGYPILTDAVMKRLVGNYATLVDFYDRETRQRKRAARLHVPVVEKTILREDETHGRLLVAPAWKAQVAEGDYVLLRCVSSPGCPFRLVGNDTTRLEGVTIYASYLVGVSAWCLTGDNYFRFTIKPGPTPAGATEARLAATNADGMQYRCCPGAVTFEGCDLGSMGDDGLWMSTIGGDLKVVEVQSPTRFRVVLSWYAPFVRRLVAMSQPGDIVRPERYGTCEPLGDLPLQSLVYEGQNPEVPRETYLTVELQQPPTAPVAVGDHLVLRKFLPEHFTIRNCRFHDTPARGLCIYASNGIIENNTIERTGRAGIWLGEYEAPGGGGGADWVSNVVVRNNVIRDTCFVNPGRVPFYGIAALLVWSQNALYPARPFNHNISLIGNTIDGCPYGGILINALDGGEVRDNVVQNTHRDGGPIISLYPQKCDLPVPYAITLMNSKNVEVADNTISDLGPGATGDVGDVGTFPATEQVSTPWGGS